MGCGKPSEKTRKMFIVNVGKVKTRNVARVVINRMSEETEKIYYRIVLG
jgi:hypothetical protein